MEKPIANTKVKLERFQAKGGWTYAPVPLLRAIKKNVFGWTRVKGLIDNYPIQNYPLMPMKDGKLFLPVKAEIRKIIKKQEGDWVKVILYSDEEPLGIPEEFADFLREAPTAHRFFYKLSDGEKKQYISWIYGAKKKNTRNERITAAMNGLSKGLKFGESEL